MSHIFKAGRLFSQFFTHLIFYSHISLADVSHQFKRTCEQMCTLAHVYVVGPTQNDQQSHDIQKTDAKVLNFILNSYLTNEKV